jgi:hypothetical protein
MIKEVNCPVCGREFKNVSGLKLHLKVHKDYDPDVKIEIITPVEEEEVVEKVELIERPSKTIAECYVPTTGEIMMTYSFDLHGIEFSTYAVNMGKKKGWSVRFK